MPEVSPWPCKECFGKETRNPCTVSRHTVSTHRRSRAFQRTGRDVVAGGPGGDTGELTVHRREGKHEAAAAGHDSLEALPEGVQRHLQTVTLHIFDGEVLARADVADRVRGVGEDDLEHQLSSGGSILPHAKISMRCGLMSTVRESEAAMASAWPPPSAKKP